MRRWVPPLVALLLVVAAGALWGVGWRLIAPTARTQVVDGSVYLQGHTELMAAQDGWFVVVGVAVCAVLSVVWLWVARRTPVATVVAGLVGSAAAGLLAWRLGTWLGPAGLRVQLRSGVKAPVTPVVLHTPVAVLFGPLAFAVVRLLVEVARRSRPGSVPQTVDVEQG